MAHFGHGAMSDLSPLCAPKRTFASVSGFMGSRPKLRSLLVELCLLARSIRQSGAIAL
jgi:hypothetical protein